MFVYIRQKYKLRKDLCEANSNYESCFIEIENVNKKNIIVGVVYRSRTAIDNFINDFRPVIQKINDEDKINFIMGDFNIDLLKDDTDTKTHEYLDLIYSYSLIPLIHKPARITEESATIILDNILTNLDSSVISKIVLTDVSDHLPTILTTNLSVKNKPHDKKYVYKRVFSDANIAKLKQRLTSVNWVSILHGNSANDDYEVFLKNFY